MFCLACGAGLKRGLVGPRPCSVLSFLTTMGIVFHVGPLAAMRDFSNGRPNRVHVYRVPSNVERVQAMSPSYVENPDHVFFSSDERSVEAWARHVALRVSSAQYKEGVCKER